MYYYLIADGFYLYGKRNIEIDGGIDWKYFVKYGYKSIESAFKNKREKHDSLARILEFDSNREMIREV